MPGGRNWKPSEVVGATDPARDCEEIGGRSGRLPGHLDKHYTSYWSGQRVVGPRFKITRVADIDLCYLLRRLRATGLDQPSGARPQRVSPSGSS